MGSQWADYCPIKDIYLPDKEIRVNGVLACDITQGMSGEVSQCKLSVQSKPSIDSLTDVLL
jgi:hypothetical protein